MTATKKTIAIMQPTYLPWLGYFDLIDRCDVFVFLDNVQFAKRSWQQRNRIKTSRGLEWLTVPVSVSGRYHQLIKDVEISDDGFADEHIELISRNYRKAKAFAEYAEPFADQIRSLTASKKLLDLNCGLINLICELLKVKTTCLYASQIGIDGKRSDLLASICKALGATTYLSAYGSAGYLIGEVDEFKRRGIDVVFHQYEHPVYEQQFPPFIPQASVIDLLLNEGSHASETLLKGRRDCYTVEQMRMLVSGSVAGEGNDS